MKLGLLSTSLKHSYSAQIHQKLSNNEYNYYEVEPKDLKDFLTNPHFDGLNVTIPYKQSVIPYLDEIDDIAKEINSVNTIVYHNNKLKGYNTDYLGFDYLIKHHNIIIKDKNITILGTGGSSQSVAYYCRKNQAKNINIISRNKDNYLHYDQIHSGDIIVNTTPVGMYPNLNEQINLINTNYQYAIDLIYNPLNTSFLQFFDQKTIKINGLLMLVAQAYYSHQLFLKQKLNKQQIIDIYHQLKDQLTNIVLIGMPTCGKSTLGKLLSEKLNKTFKDTDQLIIDKINMSIADYINKYEITNFRKLEKEVIFNLQKTTNSIIATGGGSILDYDNIKNLSYNSFIIFIDRPLSLLKSDNDHPLSNNINKLNQLYEQRLPLYQQYSNCIIKNDQTIENTIEKIKEAYDQYLSY
ncbi:MAG: shikimate kinase [Erysipelotrichaceae bacterium]